MYFLQESDFTITGTANRLPKYAAEESGQTGTSKDAPAITAADVQALIDALPEAETISEDNAADVEVQLEAIDEAKVQLSDEDFAVLDFTRYDAAVSALMALSGEPDTAFVPRLRMTTPIATAAAASQRATTLTTPM